MNRKYIILLLVVLSTTVLYAQRNKADTLTPFRDFITVCNKYKKLPLYLSIKMQNGTNYITSEEDTIQVDAEFYIRDKNSYVRFGELEQITNDSLALLVSRKMQRMILYNNAGSVIARMKAMMGTPTADSSVEKLASSYMAVIEKPTKDQSSITLNSRSLIYQTSLPKESIEIQFDAKTDFPKRVTTLKRSLMAIDSTQYAELSGQPGYSGRIIESEGAYFLIHERTTSFIYQSIEQDTKQRVPVLISDRIVRTEIGEYKPVKSYEMYSLTTD